MVRAVHPAASWGLGRLHEARPLEACAKVTPGPTAWHCQGASRIMRAGRHNVRPKPLAAGLGWQVGINKAVAVAATAALAAVGAAAGSSRLVSCCVVKLCGSSSSRQAPLQLLSPASLVLQYAGARLQNVGKACWCAWLNQHKHVTGQAYRGKQGTEGGGGAGGRGGRGRTGSRVHKGVRRMLGTKR